ncbi:MAG TPA: hypothetical protein PKY05_14365 [Fibrobacteria bacterium]|nr:hypothetical protein [Fibrobacteria bacterium]
MATSRNTESTPGAKNLRIPRGKYGGDQSPSAVLPSSISGTVPDHMLWRIHLTTPPVSEISWRVAKPVEVSGTQVIGKESQVPGSLLQLLPWGQLPLGVLIIRIRNRRRFAESLFQM